MFVDELMEGLSQGSDWLLVKTSSIKARTSAASVRRKLFGTAYRRSARTASGSYIFMEMRFSELFYSVECRARARFRT